MFCFVSVCFWIGLGCKDNDAAFSIDEQLGTYYLGWQGGVGQG